MKITLDRKSPTPLYLQIRNQVRQLILSHTMQPDYRLPPERKLADLLGVNRSTVVNAYRELEADGLIESHVGRGTTVKYVPAEEGSGDTIFPVQPLAWKQFFSRQSARMFNPLISNILDLIAREDIISFAVGVPTHEFYPVREFDNIFSELIRSNGRLLFEHGPTAGHYPLREYLAGFMEKRGIEVEPENIIILSGSQQGLDIITRVFLEPGDAVVMEEPSYLGAVQVFGAAGARIFSVPLDEEGLRTDVLEQILSRYHPKLIYTLPTFQNPSGITMSAARRAELLRLSYRYHVPVLEDDPYGELYYEGGPVPSLKSMDAHEHVSYLGTFSKILFPGLRLGWFAAPPPLIRQLVMAKQLTDLHSNTMSQWAVDAFCRKGLLEEHLSRVRKEYANRRDAMLCALEEFAPPGLRWNRPEGGLYLWCELPEGVNAGALLNRAAGKMVAFLPGDAFFANGGGADRIRLSFSRYPGETIREGIRRICETIGEMLFAEQDKKKTARSRQEAGPLV